VINRFITPTEIQPPRDVYFPQKKLVHETLRSMCAQAQLSFRIILCSYTLFYHVHSHDTFLL